MSRRPSVASLSSIGSGLMKPIQLPGSPDTVPRPQRSFSNSSFQAPSRKASLNVNLDAIVERSTEVWDPDELFTKHTVAEVKAIQQRLRMEADAKQEELRLMVGERYRDLLQASTSIISIAQSSDNVLHALDDARNVTSSLQPRKSAQMSADAQGDEHLQTLQSLAAHLKLLLDAPEHLWRFMERKLYLHAAWLFLLARVVHRSLLREEEDEDAAWHGLGIHISDQFPIVQRQWDAVSQFRSQVSHKATMALRECNATTPEVCAILLTLHLLESRPLPETLATFLAQRTRSLTAALNRARDRSLNGSAPEPPTFANGPIAKSRKVVLRELRQKLKAVLRVLVRTIEISRAIFLQEERGAKLPLMAEVLKYVQGEDDAAEKTLPPEVRLSSQILLSSLPSSNHFLLLPITVRLYRPYVDDSSLQNMDGQDFGHKLQEWFQKALNSMKTAMEAWFAELSTIRDLWQIRIWYQASVRSANGLDVREVEELYTILDSVCSQQATKIWKTVLASTDLSFRERLASALNAVAQEFDRCPDAQPVQYLFDVAPLSSMTQAASSVSSNDSSFLAYRQTLQRQITARTPLVDDVLSTVEKSVKTLHEDLGAMKEHSDDTRSLSQQLLQDYGPEAEALCLSLCRALQLAVDGLDDTAASDIRSVIFLGRIADHLSKSTLFKDSIGCSTKALEEFSTALNSLYGRTLERWQGYTISQVISARWPLSLPHDNESPMSGDSPQSPKPSSRLLDSLLALASALQELGIHTDAGRLSTLTQQTLHRFVIALIHHIDIPKVQRQSASIVWDMNFLLLLAEAWAPAMDETRTLLLKSLSRGADQSSWAHVREGLVDWLSRLQVLLGILLPSRKSPSAKVDQGKPSSLLHLGLPTVDAQYQPAFELVKPSARFGLLLVGSSVAR